ncbi:allantoin permease [Coniochaeta sp. 2T2.1]|nr:allantoin permease [Coniochaeta sp. 2T2.1]
MTTIFREKVSHIRADLKPKRKLSGWVLPRQTTSFADEGSWTNIDCGVTPIERRTWSSWTMLGYWFSDALNAQSWMAPASIIAVGLTWREAVVAIIFGSLVCTVPLVLNGIIGARLHIPFPTYTGSTAMTQITRSIWPSYLDIPNHIPDSVDITAQGMVSHLIFWLNLPYRLNSTARSWLILSSLSSITGGWATLATNIPDFTRYLKTDKGVYWQVLFLPGIQLMLGLFGIICCSASKRGVVIATVTAAWVMQPWKIVYSAASLLAFMAGLGTFLVPIAAILGADYWITHKRHLDVPGLYRAHGRYRYGKYGPNWRAAVAFLVSVVLSLPGMASSVNPSILPHIGGAEKLYYMFYFWGYASAFLVYAGLSHFFPAPETIVPATIYEGSDVMTAGSFHEDMAWLGYA